MVSLLLNMILNRGVRKCIWIWRRRCLILTKRGLGKGLEALIPMQEKSEEDINEISIKRIVANVNQPRKDFDEQKLNELAESMKQHGVLQPIILRKKKQI